MLLFDELKKIVVIVSLYFWNILNFQHDAGLVLILDFTCMDVELGIVVYYTLELLLLVILLSVIFRYFLYRQLILKELGVQKRGLV